MPLPNPTPMSAEDEKLREQVMQAARDQCLKLLIDTLDDLRKDAGTPLDNRPTSSETLADLSFMLSHEITKFAVFVSKSPDVETMVPLSQKLAAQMTMLVCSMRTLLKSAGPTMKQQIAEMGSDLIDRLKRVIMEFKQKIAAGQAQAYTASLTGAVNELCKEIPKIPQQNSVAINKVLLTQLATIRDAKNELDELRCKEPAVSETPLGNEEAKTEDADDEDANEDEDDESNTLSPSEFEVVPPALELVKAAFNLNKKLCTFITKCQQSDADPQHVAWLEAQLASSKAVAHAVDQLVSSVYSPQSKDSMTTACTTMKAQLTGILKSLRDHPAFATPDSKSEDAASSAASSSAVHFALPSSSSSDSPSVSPDIEWLNSLGSVVDKAVASILAHTKT